MWTSAISMVWRGFARILDQGTRGLALPLVKDGDIFFFQRISTVISIRDPGSVAVSKVKVHIDEFFVVAGNVRIAALVWEWP